MTMIDEELTRARAKIRELEQQLEVANRTNAAVRNIIHLPLMLGPAILAKLDAGEPVDPELVRWLRALPDAVDALPPAMHTGARRAGELPS